MEVNDVDKWEVVEGSRSTPQQNNKNDCGVFSCTTANYLDLDLDLSFSAKHMDNFRRRMTLELLDKKLMG